VLNSIHHAAIICSDYQKSKHFYVSILGLEVIAENYREERDSFKLDLKLSNGGQIELFSFPNAPDRLSFPEALGLRHLAFNVESVESVKAHLLSRGVAVEPIRVDAYTNRKFTFFSDPDGLPLELYEQTGI
jgi:glyoxylase I family protein